MIRFGFLTLLAASLLATERLELSRSDGSALVSYYDTPAKDSFPILLLIQGAQLESVKRLHQSLKGSAQEKKWGIVSIEKRGISESEPIDQKEYLTHYSLTERLADYQLFC